MNSIGEHLAGVESVAALGAANGTFDQTLWPMVAVCGAMLVFSLALQWLQRREKKYLAEANARLERLVTERTRDLEAANVRLAEMATTDELTGLKNRRFLEEIVGQELSRVRRENRRLPAIPASLTFMMIDMDFFKSVNDEHGHNGGDQVLRQAAKVLDRVARDSDFLCRWGGEEFLVVTRSTEAGSARIAAERFRAAIAEEAFQLDSRETVKVTCSVGYCVYPYEQSSAGDERSCIALADLALYEAKAAGRNCWIGVEGAPDEVWPAVRRRTFDELVANGDVKLLRKKKVAAA